jgi:hypothetical protein
MRSQSRKIRFNPIRLKARHDGWTPARQYRFIEELAATGSITRACSAVGMSRESAYALRDRPEQPANDFARAWAAALTPDFAQPRRSPAGRRRAKVDEVKEVERPPDSGRRPRSASSALTTLETLLRQLRAEPASPASR